MTSERERIALVCVVCSSRNYRTSKAKRGGAEPKRLVLKKFCPTCGSHTEHKESK